MAMGWMKKLYLQTAQQNCSVQAECS
jgi:hypothetical protein